MIKKIRHLRKKDFLVFVLRVIFFLLVMNIFVIENIAFAKKEKNFDVDLVYLWCDGDDPIFADQKNYWLKQENGEQNLNAVADGRFVQVDELKYSLRSVEKYMPWVHHIYIVTDGQIPSWLNTKHPKITIVDHSEIISKKYLPVFNASAIETSIYKIPNLSEHFLFANDDMFVNRPLEKGFFFEKEKVIVRIFESMLKDTSFYHSMLNNAISLIERDFGQNTFFSKRSCEPHHNIDAYLKSDYEACAKHFEKEFTETLTHRFRKKTSVQRFIISIWSFIKGHAIIKKMVVNDQVKKATDSLYISNQKTQIFALLKAYQPALFCINDTEYSTWEDRMRTKEFLEKYFPKKSQFEL